MSQDIKEIPLKKIKPKPEQPRSVFNEERIKELADSIKEHGLIQPITVRPLKDDFYQIITGERRYRAHKLLGLKSIKCLIIEDERDDFIISLIENLQREDLSPIEEAEAYRKLLNSGLTQEKLGKIISKSQSLIAQKLALLILPELVKILLRNKEISEGHGRQLLRFRKILDDFVFPKEKEIINNCFNVYPFTDEHMKTMTKKEAEIGEEEVVKRYSPKTIEDWLLIRFAFACLTFKWSVAELKKDINNTHCSFIERAIFGDPFYGKGYHRLVGKIDFKSLDHAMKGLF